MMFPRVKTNEEAIRRSTLLTVEVQGPRENCHMFCKRGYHIFLRNHSLPPKRHQLVMRQTSQLLIMKKITKPVCKIDFFIVICVILGNFEFVKLYLLSTFRID